MLKAPTPQMPKTNSGTVDSKTIQPAAPDCKTVNPNTKAPGYKEKSM